MKCFRTLYRYQHMTLYEPSKLVMLWQDEVLNTINNAYGVWQGAPLGMHNFCLSAIDFCMLLITFNFPHRIFESPSVLPASHVLIADDLTVTMRQNNIVHTLKFIKDEAQPLPGAGQVRGIPTSLRARERASRVGDQKAWLQGDE